MVSDEEALTRVRAELEAGREEEALRALKEAFQEAKTGSDTEALREVASLAGALQSRSPSPEARRLEYAASQNVRLLERQAALGVDTPLPPREDYVLGSWIRRVFAFAFDALVVVGILYVIPLAALYSAFEAGGSDFQETSVGGLVLFFALIGLPLLWPISFALFHGLGPGQTPGKRLLGIAVRDVRGTRLGLGRAFGRAYFVLFLAWFVTGIGLLIDCLWPLWDKRNQALHDKVVGSVVVRIP